jgi:hypothetical protein
MIRFLSILEIHRGVDQNYLCYLQFLRVHLEITFPNILASLYRWLEIPLSIGMHIG